MQHSRATTATRSHPSHTPPIIIQPGVFNVFFSCFALQASRQAGRPAGSWMKRFQAGQETDSRRKHIGLGSWQALCPFFLILAPSSHGVFRRRRLAEMGHAFDFLLCLHPRDIISIKRPGWRFASSRYHTGREARGCASPLGQGMLLGGQGTEPVPDGDKVVHTTQ